MKNYYNETMIKTKLGEFLDDMLSEFNQINYDDFEILRFIENNIFDGKVVMQFLRGRTIISVDGEHIVNYKHRTIFRDKIFPYNRICELELGYHEIHENCLLCENNRWILIGFGLKLLQR